MRKKKSSADLPWYEKDLPWDEEELLWGLYDASMELKQLPLLGQIMALKAIARHLRRRVPDGLLEPLESIYTDLMNEAAAMTSDDKPGPHPAPLDRRIVEAHSAATVTVLKNCGWKVGDAITEVAKRTGLDPERLRYFRDEIHRGRADELARKVYDGDVKRDKNSSPHLTREQRVDFALHCTQFFTVGRPFKFDFSDL